jgi:hypothetical protein
MHGNETLLHRNKHVNGLTHGDQKQQKRYTYIYFVEVEQNSMSPL